MTLDPLSLVLALVICAMALLGVRLLGAREPSGPRKRALPVLQPKCSRCTSWSRKGAQAQFKRMGAFAQVMNAIEPWEFIHRGKKVPNPEYLAVEAELEKLNEVMATTNVQEAHEALEEERTRLLDELAKLSPETWKRPDASEIPKEDLEMEWTDWGLCSVHRELRLNRDSCGDFEEDLELQESLSR